MTRKPYLKNINGLRFLAASYVIGFHYFNLPDSRLLSRIFSHGHISVPFFFLLSGFVLFYTYDEYDFQALKNIKKYLINRYIRLAPIYYFAMFLAVPLIYHKQKTNGFLPVWENVVYIATHLSFAQSMVPFSKLIAYWNIHSWSLGVEMVLYITSPFIIRWIQEVHTKKLIPLLLGFTTLNGIIFALSIHPSKPLGDLSFFFAPLYLPTFFSGVTLAKYYLFKKNIVERNSIFLFPITSLILMASFIADFSDSFYSAFNPFFHIGFSILILSACNENTFNRWLGTGLMVLLGDASYAMYILQAPIKTAVQQFLSKILGFSSSEGFLYCIFVFTGITFFSVIVSKYFDPHWRKKLKVFFIKPKSC